MRIYSRNHTYRYVPNYLNNRQLPADQQIVVLLKSISAPENDSFQHYCQSNRRGLSEDKAQELNEARFSKLVADKFIGVEGLEIEGLKDKKLDYQTFYDEAPQVLVNEIIRVVQSSELLTLGEQKNFVPESGLPSPAPADV